MTKEDLATNDHAFSRRHIGPTEEQIALMLKAIEYRSLSELVKAAIPQDIFLNQALNLPAPLNEEQALNELRHIALKNKIYKSYIGQGYYGTSLPAVIKRNILQNPGWYTQYTPYQAEISQGRLEALLNFQTLTTELTGLPFSNASLLDEGTACAEAMVMLSALRKDGVKKQFFLAANLNPQTIGVVKTRALARGICVVVGQAQEQDWSQFFGAILAYPGVEGQIEDHSALIDMLKQKGVGVCLCCDLLALTVLKSPGELGADIACGSAQRLGTPMGFGGPHAGFITCSQAYKRLIPGRIVGVSKDKFGQSALRLSLQTREQHIRREKAASNICTAQALLAIINSMYAVYHGPSGLKQIALLIHKKTKALAKALNNSSLRVRHADYFDTLCLVANNKSARDFYLNQANAHQINLGKLGDNQILVSFDEQTSWQDVLTLVNILQGKAEEVEKAEASPEEAFFSEKFLRKTAFLKQRVFNRYHSETELMRYIKSLENKDLSLTYGMIPLGSCTMKLNAAVELEAISWPEFANIHPFAPKEQVQGYLQLFADLERWLCEITGYDAVSLQPNSGAQGEFAGLLAVKAYHEKRGEKARNICLVPVSAHGTNPATASMVGFEVVSVECDNQGNISLADLETKIALYKETLAVLMVTYPSTHGVFERKIAEICKKVKEAGGLIYLDGANLNAQLGLCRPGDYGSNVSHLNLHKTFCIPHGGGGPGAGPIGVKKALAPFLPSHSVVKVLPEDPVVGEVASGPWGSALILVVPWMFIRMMGAKGLKKASSVAILNANYVAKRLSGSYSILFKGENGLVAHECIVDFREIKAKSGVDVMDVAKRLMDYGFHSPTVAFPVAQTMMIEPTESESIEELDRFCDAMLKIHEEILQIIKDGELQNNVLKNAPHIQRAVCHDEWPYPYSRAKAAFPVSFSEKGKYWPAVARIDEAYGDRNLICTCQA